MQGELEAPASSSELYLAQGDDVPAGRPLLTGDIVQGIEIPGLAGSGDAAVLTHPCSMRKDGVELADRLLVARVRKSSEIPLSRWKAGHFRVMPLPDLYGEGTHAAAFFEEIGLVDSMAVEGARRIACLSRRGINLLQQRFVWYLTRFAVPTHRLHEVTAAVLEEADLAEEWATAFLARGYSLQEAMQEFHKWIRAEDASGAKRQDRLRNPQELPAVRRSLREELKRRSLP